MHLGAARQLRPFAGALFNRRDESGLRDDDIAAEREDLRFVLVRIDHRGLRAPPSANSLPRCATSTP
jgi:hypothetical protein